MNIVRVMLTLIVLIFASALVIAVQAQQNGNGKQKHAPRPPAQQLHCPLPFLPWIDLCARQDPENTCEIQSPDGYIKRVPCPKDLKK